MIRVVHTLALLLVALLLMGATGSMPGLHLDDRLQSHLITQRTFTLNKTDLSNLVPQGGRDDTDPINIGNDNDQPPGFSGSRRVYEFDGSNEYGRWGHPVMGHWSSVCAWIAPSGFNFGIVGTAWDTSPASGFRNLITSFLGISIFVRGGTNSDPTNWTGGSTIIPAGNVWTFTCTTWSGVSGDKIRVYNSRTNNTDPSIIDCGWNGIFQPCRTQDAAYGSPDSGYTIGTTVLLLLDYEGLMSNYTGWDGLLTETEVCMVCRCAVDNMQRYPPTGDYDMRAIWDRYEECNECTLPTIDGVAVTHCGPPRHVSY